MIGDINYGVIFSQLAFSSFTIRVVFLIFQYFLSVLFVSLTSTYSLSSNLLINSFICIVINSFSFSFMYSYISIYISYISTVSNTVLYTLSGNIPKLSCLLFCLKNSACSSFIKFYLHGQSQFILQCYFILFTYLQFHSKQRILHYYFLYSYLSKIFSCRRSLSRFIFVFLITYVLYFLFNLSN